jgi:hypothetical protein
MVATTPPTAATVAAHWQAQAEKKIFLNPFFEEIQSFKQKAKDARNAVQRPMGQEKTSVTSYSQNK